MNTGHQKTIVKGLRQKTNGKRPNAEIPARNNPQQVQRPTPMSETQRQKHNTKTQKVQSKLGMSHMQLATYNPRNVNALE